MIARRQALQLALGVAATTLLRPASAQRAPVDLELILAVDVSRSVDDMEYELQKKDMCRR